jgi:hypothetical protein
MRLPSVAFALMTVTSNLGCSDDVDSVHRDADAISPSDDADTEEFADIATGDAFNDVSVDDSLDGADLSDPDAGPRWPDILFGEPLPEASDFVTGHAALGDLVATTLTETLRPRFGFGSYLDAEGRLLVPLDAVGRLEPQPGEPHLLRDQLALPEGAETELSTWTIGALPEDTRSYFYALVLSDPQLVDVDSPAQVAKNAAVTFSGFALPAYRPHGEFAPALVDSLIRSANRFATPRPFDAALICGDLAENGQKNELAWIHTLLMGGEVLPDSGARDDVIPGPGNDAFDPFIAEGLGLTPWVAVVGNHDILINGNFPPSLIRKLYEDPALLDALVELTDPLGLTVPGDPLADIHPALFPHDSRAAFRVDPDAFHPLQLPTADELLALAPAPSPTDPERAPQDVCGFVELHRRLGGSPEGHGFSARNEEDCTGFFTWDPVPGLPLRIIALMLGPAEGGPSGILSRPAEGGKLDLTRAYDPRFDQIAFLETELARAKTEGVAVIVMSHQRSDDLSTDAFLRSLLPLFAGTGLDTFIESEIPAPVDPLSTEAFRTLLASSGHVLAHLSGHTHTSGILAICADGSARGPNDDRCPPGASGETGYWEVTTGGAISFPHQGRLLELVHAGGSLAGLYLTMVDPRIPSDSFLLRGLFTSIVGEQMGSAWGGSLGTRLDRNVLLPVALPASVAESMTDYDAHTTLVSETTLYETRPALPPLPVRP